MTGWENFVSTVETQYDTMNSLKLQPMGVFANSMGKDVKITRILRDIHPDEPEVYLVRTTEGKIPQLVRNDGILTLIPVDELVLRSIVPQAELDIRTSTTGWDKRVKGLLSLGDAKKDIESAITWLEENKDRYFDADSELERWLRFRDLYHDREEVVDVTKMGLDDADRLEAELEEEIRQLEASQWGY